jgi:hypothetical protein
MVAPVFFYGLGWADLSSDQDTETGSPGRRSAQLAGRWGLPESKNFILDVLNHKKAAKS